MNNNAIGMIDSGVGGLTVLKEVIKELPRENIIYLGDTKRFPYGSKSKETIVKCTKQAIDFLLTKNVKIIVIACGTATSQALEYVQKIYNIPIIGIIKPTVEYLAQEKSNKTIGIIATNGTINSNSWEKELLSKNSNLKIISKPCPLLAPMAEEGWTENEIAALTIKEYLKDLKNVDKLILGCTHYSLFTTLIEKELGDNAKIINTGIVVAKYLKKFLQKEDLQSNKEEAIYQTYLTDLDCNFINIANKFIDKELKFQKIEI